MVFLLGSIAVKHLYLDSRQIVGNDVARHIDRLRREVVNLLYRACPSHLVSILELVYLGLMYVPQHLVRQVIGCHMFLYRVEYVNGILVLTKQNDSHIFAFSCCLLLFVVLVGGPQVQAVLTGLVALMEGSAEELEVSVTLPGESRLESLADDPLALPERLDMRVETR